MRSAVSYYIQRMIGQSYFLTITKFFTIFPVEPLQTSVSPRFDADSVYPGPTQVSENFPGAGKMEDFPLLVRVVKGEMFADHSLHLLQGKVIQADTGELPDFPQVVRPVHGEGQGSAWSQVVGQFYQQPFQIMEPVKG